MRARDSRLADRLMFVVSVTTNLSQRIAGRLVQLPAPVTFILSQLAPVSSGRISFARTPGSVSFQSSKNSYLRRCPARARGLLASTMNGIAFTDFMCPCLGPPQSAQGGETVATGLRQGITLRVRRGGAWEGVRLTTL